MKTLDSIIERFENLIATSGMDAASPQAVVASWELESGLKVAPDAITELLRVWLEYRFASGSPATPSDATELFPEIAFSAAQLRLLHFEHRRLQSSGSDSNSFSAHGFRAVSQLPQLGETWDGFLLLEILGEGAFARVYLARQLGMAGRLVALKLSYRASLESQLLARLHHSAIVPIYSMHHQQDVYGFCMPYLGNTTLMDLLSEIRASRTDTLRSIDSVDGNNLLEILNHRQANITTVARYWPDQDTHGFQSHDGNHRVEISGQDPVEATNSADGVCEVSRSRSTDNQQRNSGFPRAQELSKLNYVGAITWIVAQLADALDHAHRQGVLHCDIKPANVLLAPDGQARLLDFNVALESRRSIAEGRVGGTFAYMAPEHLAAVQGMVNSSIDERSDIYSLGIVLFEMLSGIVPRSHAQDEQVPVGKLLRESNPSVTPALIAIVSKCIANQPNERYSTAAQLYEDLTAQCNHLPLIHQAEPSIKERTSKWVRRHSLLTSVSSISVLAASLLIVSLMGLSWKTRQLERLEKSNRSERLRSLLPAAIAQLSAARQYPELVPEARQKTAAVIELLRNPNDHSFDRTVLADWTAVSKLVRLGNANHSTLHQDATDRDLSFAKFDDELTDSISELEASMPELSPASLIEGRFLSAYMDGQFSTALEIGQQLSEAESIDYSNVMLLGQCHLKAGDFAAARESFSICISLQPKIEIAWFYRGIARLESMQYKAAASDFTRSVQLRSIFPSARYNLALAYDSLGETEAAFDALNHAIEAGWQSVSGYAFRADLHKKLGDDDQSEQDLARAIACTPSTELDWIRRGTLRLTTDPDAARKDFEQAVRANPTSLAGRQNLAHVLAERLSEPEMALEHLDQLVQQDATNAERWSSRGVVLGRLGRWRESIQDINHAATLGPSNPMVAYQIACGYSLLAPYLQDDEHRLDNQAAETQTSEMESGNRLPSQRQVGESALQWYTYALELRPDLAQIADSDPDMTWLRSQPNFDQLARSFESRNIGPEVSH